MWMWMLTYLEQWLGKGGGGFEMAYCDQFECMEQVGNALGLEWLIVD